MENTIYDIIIIGVGPAGISSLIYAKRGCASVLLLESNPYGCGQISLTERVDNYPGLFGIEGFELGEKFRSHAKALGGDIHKAKVVSITKENDIFTVTTEKNETFKSKFLVCALGCVHRHLNIPGEDKFFAKGVSYCATCDASFYKNKTVAVVGGGDTALSDVLTLSKVCSKVYLIHRRDSFRANKTLVEKVKGLKNIKILYNENVTTIEGDKRVERAVLKNQVLDVDGVFVAIGEQPQSELIKNFVDLDDNGYIITDEDCQTKTKSLYAVGDVRKKRLRQVVTAVSDGAVAVTKILEE